MAKAKAKVDLVEAAADIVGTIANDIGVRANVTPANVHVVLSDFYDGQYSVKLNEFIDTMFNKVVLTLIENTDYISPYDVFQEEQSNFGTDAELLFTQAVRGIDREPITNETKSQLLDVFSADIRVKVIRENRGANGIGQRYPITWAEADTERAFSSPQAFAQAVATIAQALYNGSMLDRMEITHNMINDAIAAGILPTVNVLGTPSDPATSTELVKALGTTHDEFMVYPTTRYNMYNIAKDPERTDIFVQTRQESDIVVLLPIKTNVDISVDVLAQAFNLEKADLIGRVIKVPPFEDESVAAVICDRRALYLKSKPRRLGSIYDPDLDVRQVRLIERGTFDFNPFRNIAVIKYESITPPVPGNYIQNVVLYEAEPSSGEFFYTPDTDLTLSFMPYPVNATNRNGLGFSPLSDLIANGVVDPQNVRIDSTSNDFIKITVEGGIPASASGTTFFMRGYHPDTGGEFNELYRDGVNGATWTFVVR